MLLDNCKAIKNIAISKNGVPASGPFHNLFTTLRPNPDAESAPLTGLVATFALRTEFAPVHVIIIMATVTGLRNDDAIIHLFFMAGVAIYFLMSAVNLEFGARVVIEIPRFPGSRVVA